MDDGFNLQSGLEMVGITFDETPRLVIFGVSLLLAIAVGLAFGTEGRTLPLVVCLVGVAAMGLHLARQMRRVDITDPQSCLAVFRSNRNAGLLPAAFFALALLL